jgi:hypothetical protein
LKLGREALKWNACTMVDLLRARTAENCEELVSKTGS